MSAVPERLETALTLEPAPTRAARDFAAPPEKAPPATSPMTSPTPAPRRPVIAADKRPYAMLGALMLAALAIGAYVLYDEPPTPAPLAAPPAPAPAVSIATTAAAFEPQTPMPAAAANALLSPPASTTPPEAPPETAPTAPSPPTADPAPATAPLRISSSAPALDPALAAGYRLLQQGDLAAARSAYDTARRNDPHNTDVLLGLATIARRAEDREGAEALYLQALAADPKNATALAGLLGLHEQSDPAHAESRLKSLLNSQRSDADPGGAAHFALGNLYAGQRRWNEAQQAYFQAYAIDAGNPDFHYNLAVSLDHLRQQRLAAQFYRSALTAAQARAAAFDRTRAQIRLAELLAVADTAGKVLADTSAAGDER